MPTWASSFKYNGKETLPIPCYRFLIENLHEEEIVCDYFDRQESLPQYTYVHNKQLKLLGPFFYIFISQSDVSGSSRKDKNVLIIDYYQALCQNRSKVCSVVQNIPLC